MFTVFINDYPIYLTDNLKYNSNANFGYFYKVDIENLIKKLEDGEIKDAYLYDTDVMVLYEKFRKKFRTIEAAGGVVKNSRGEILFIYRNDVWDLPKGKIEKGEEIEDAAFREVEEETGVKQLNIIEPLNSTYHIYSYKNTKIFKITYWYKMGTDYTGELYPQFEEGIIKAKWLDKEQIKMAMKNTYANIRLLIEEAI